MTLVSTELIILHIYDMIEKNNKILIKTVKRRLSSFTLNHTETINKVSIQTHILIRKVFKRDFVLLKDNELRNRESKNIFYDKMLLIRIFIRLLLTLLKNFS